MSPVFGVAGGKGSGKTTLPCAVVAEFTRRDLRAATPKHTHHNFDIDREGTDSFRHRSAGAGEVAIAASRRWALMHEAREESEPAPEGILARLSPCDLVPVESDTRAPHLKIEDSFRVFHLDDMTGIADLIAAELEGQT